LEHNIKAYVKNLSEVFWFIHQFAVLGKEEVRITQIVVYFYNKQLQITAVGNVSQLNIHFWLLAFSSFA